METRVVEHGMDLGGLLGFSCTDLQVNPISVGWSSHPGSKGVRLDLHQATYDGFCWPEDGVCGVGAGGSGRARASGGHVALPNNQPGQSILLGTGACWCGD